MSVSMRAARLPRRGSGNGPLSRASVLRTRRRRAWAKMMAAIGGLVVSPPASLPRGTALLPHALRFLPGKRRAALQCAVQLVAVAMGTVAMAYVSWSATVDQRLAAEQRRLPAPTADLEGSLRGDLTRSTTDGVSRRTTSAPAQDRDGDGGAGAASAVSVPGPVMAGGSVVVVTMAGLLLGRLVLRRYRAMDPDAARPLMHLPWRGEREDSDEPEDVETEASRSGDELADAPDDSPAHVRDDRDPADTIVEATVDVTAEPAVNVAPEAESTPAYVPGRAERDTARQGAQQQELAEGIGAGLPAQPDAEQGSRNMLADTDALVGQRHPDDESAGEQSTTYLSDDRVGSSWGLPADDISATAGRTRLKQDLTLELPAEHVATPLMAETGQRLYERRAAVRVQYVAAGVLEHQGHRRSITVLDLSESGVRCLVESASDRRAPAAPANGEYVRVSFPVTSRTLNVKAQVAWRRAGNDGVQLGLSFVSPSAETAERIRDACFAAAG